MTIQKAIDHFKDHQRTSLKRRTQEGYKRLLECFQSEFHDRDVESIKAEELCRFLETNTEGLARSTRRLRYAQLRALFNFVINTFEMNIKNPCCVPQLFKSFKNIQQRPRKILDKEKKCHHRLRMDPPSTGLRTHPVFFLFTLKALFFSVLALLFSGFMWVHS